MKKCPFCGEEIQDAAKKCRFCNEWLEFKDCPFCGEQIPAKSTICSFCNEKIDTGGLPPDPVSPTGKGFLNFLKNNLVLVILTLLILLFAFRFWKGGKSASQDDFRSSEYFVSKQSTFCEGCYTGELEPLHFTGMDGGYLLYNDNYSCVVKIENIKKFEDSINKGIFKYCDTDILEDNTDINDKMIAIIMDNSYSESTGLQGDHDLNNKIKAIGNIINGKEFGENIDLSLHFIYNTRATENEPEIINCNAIDFSIDRDEFPIEVKIFKSSKNKKAISYVEDTQYLKYNGLSLVPLRGTGILCKEIGGNKYVCYDKLNMYKKILEIWNADYNNVGLHEGNPLFECLNNSRLYGNDEIYVITDGQFELTDNQKDLKQLSSKYSFKEFPLTNFHHDVYAIAPDKFDRFWSGNVSKLGSGIDCGGKNVYFVGLRKDPPFYNYMINYYKNNFFRNCNVFEK